MNDHVSSHPVFLMRGHKLLVDLSSGVPRVPDQSVAEEFGLSLEDGYRLGSLDGVDCHALSVTGDGEPPRAMDYLGLRKLFGVLDDARYDMAVRALAILNWDRTCRFCSACGSALRRHESILAKVCETCGFTMFPRISPAVIVLVERQEKVLLARASRFAENLYSVLAGFAEPGETLEDTVRREVMEEVGVEVSDIRYFGSQPWPYPDSLMIGFTASWAAGEIAADNDEITDARWFTVDDLPRIPDRLSISRSLIDWFIDRHRKGK
jgi:NAD+ diphosphatase